MSVPFQLLWTDASNNVLPIDWFPISFPGTVSSPIQVQVRSNAGALQTYETLTNVKFFLTGDPDDVNTVQNIWPFLGSVSKPELNGGYEISFDFGRTYTRFSTTMGLETDPSTWIPLPVEAVGSQGTDQTLGAFDTAHLIVRVVVPPGATQFKALDIRLGLDFDII
jgi:hypothetical protein